MTVEERSMGMPELMEIAVAIEQQAATFYGALAKRFIEDPEIQNVFRTLSRDEVNHRDQFAALRSRVQRMETAPSKQRAMELQARTLEAFFPEGVDEKADTIATLQDALQLALQFEKTTLTFYESMQDELGNEPTLASLIGAEKRHVEVIMRTMVTGAKLRSTDDDFTGKQPEGAARQDARLHTETKLGDLSK